MEIERKRKEEELRKQKEEEERKRLEEEKRRRMEIERKRKEEELRKQKEEEERKRLEEEKRRRMEIERKRKEEELRKQNEEEERKRLEEEKRRRMEIERKRKEEELRKQKEEEERKRLEEEKRRRMELEQKRREAEQKRRERMLRLRRERDARFKSELQRLLSEEFRSLFTPLPPHSVKLNLVPFFKKSLIRAHFSFESDSPDSIQDELGSSTSFLHDPEHPGDLVPGRFGKGYFLSSKTSFRLAPFKLRIPRSFTLQYSLFPLRLDRDEARNLFTLRGESESPVIQVILIRDRVVVRYPQDDLTQETNLLLQENVWQNLLVSFDQEEKFLTFQKNGHLMAKRPLEARLPLKLDILMGHDTNRLSPEMIVDDVLLYGKSFEQNHILPRPPSNAEIIIKEGEVIEGPTLTLLFFCHNATEYMLSHSLDFIDGRWKPFKSRVTFPVKQVTGEHTVFIKFRNDANLETPVFRRPYIWGAAKRDEIRFINPLPDSRIPGKR
jgi:hypothetical protein